MPELPEVETVRRHLSMRLAGQRLVGFELKRNDLRYPIPRDRLFALAGSTVDAVRRRAKYLLVALRGPPCDGSMLLVHLGMSGRLFVTDEPDPPWLVHEHWRGRFDGERGQQLLRYQDARRFGALDVVDEQGEAGHRLLARLGVEPLEGAFDGPWLWQQTRGSRMRIKAWLMDARKVVGVGNIYASEACYRARVHPMKLANQLSRPAAMRLAAAVKSVLDDAIAAGGSSLKDFVGGDAAPGYVQQQLDVYGKFGEPCSRCHQRGAIDRNTAQCPRVKRRVLQGRATYFCARCQR